MTSTSTTLENLLVGTRYEVQVKAISDVGAGLYSDVRMNTTFRGTVKEFLNTCIWNSCLAILFPVPRCFRV